MSVSDDDPFQRRDTRPYFGKTDRRESHRASVRAIVRPKVKDGHDEVVFELDGSLSLNGFFIELDQVDVDLTGTTVHLELDLLDEGMLKITLPIKTPVGRPGFIVRLDALDFEEARQVARYLDQHVGT